MHEDEFKKLAQHLPPIFSRTEVRSLFGGIISPGYLANLDSRGEGPPSVRIGKKRAYPRDGFIEWLQARSKMNLAGCCTRGSK